MSPLDMTDTPNGAQVQGFPLYPGFTFDVDIDWKTGRARAYDSTSGQVRGYDERTGAADGFRLTRPRRSRKTPTREDVARICRFVESQHGHGCGFLVVDFVAAAFPVPRTPGDGRSRGGRHGNAEAIAAVYGAARSQGLAARKVISQLYGFEWKDVPGERTEYHDTVLGWIKRAYKQGYLTKLDANGQSFEKGTWPGGAEHPLELRRAAPLLKPRQPESGRVLTLYAAPSRTLGTNDDGESVAEVEIVGRWSDGEPVDDEDVQPLQAVTLVEAVSRLLPAKSKDLERKYPGAVVRITITPPR